MPRHDKPNQQGKTPTAAFVPDEFAKAIQGQGLDFRWSRAVECPCRLEGTDQWKPSCASCGGDGWKYINPNIRDERHHARDYLQVRCLFAQVALNMDLFQQFGGFMFSDALLTVQQPMRVGFRDRFIGLDQEMPWTEVLSRGADRVVPIGKTGRTTAAQTTAMRYEPVRVNYVEDEDETVYWGQTDYGMRPATRTEPTKMVWKTGKGPAEGKAYTVHYVCRPVWIVESASFAIQAAQATPGPLSGTLAPRSLPTTFKVRLDFLTQARGS